MKSDRGAVDDGIWTTKQGVQLKYSEMTDSHLANTIKMLIRGSCIQKAYYVDTFGTKDFGEYLHYKVAPLTEEFIKRGKDPEELRDYLFINKAISKALGVIVRRKKK